MAALREALSPEWLRHINELHRHGHRQGGWSSTQAEASKAGDYVKHFSLLPHIPFSRQKFGPQSLRRETCWFGGQSIAAGSETVTHNSARRRKGHLFFRRPLVSHKQVFGGRLPEQSGNDKQSAFLEPCASRCTGSALCCGSECRILCENVLWGDTDRKGRHHRVLCFSLGHQTTERYTWPPRENCEMFTKWWGKKAELLLCRILALLEEFSSSPFPSDWQAEVIKFLRQQAELI